MALQTQVRLRSRGNPLFRRHGTLCRDRRRGGIKPRAKRQEQKERFQTGAKIWLTQEADAKSWSSLKHVQPKEGRKELAPREIKFRYRRLDTTIRERAGSSQVPREAQESERYPVLFFFVSFFSSFLIRDVVAKSLRAMEETRADRSLPWEQ